MNWIGLDIGGANVKISTAAGAESHAFELWKYPHELANFIAQHVSPGNDTRIAVTMTGELADGYENKQLGVTQIVDAVESVFPGSLYYQTTGEFVLAGLAKSNWLNTAAANWHALACWICLGLEFSAGFVIDIGSTTTDIVPIENGAPCGGSRTDLDRLTRGELIYTGVKRSPINGLVSNVQINNQKIPLANEAFATIEDALVVANRIPEQNHVDTADGRTQTRSHASQRISRMVCSDISELGQANVDLIANQICRTHRTLIATSLGNVVKSNPDTPLSFVVCGEGEWLADEVACEYRNGKTQRLSQQVPKHISLCAPAEAVRQLAQSVKCQSIG